MFRKIKLADALAHPGRSAKTGHHGPPADPKAEMVREAQESARAHEAGSSNRDRMVAIGRGNQQAGRQK